MKRSFLIAGGALGGLGAVLAVTPPQFGSSDSALALGAAPAGAPAAPASAATTATPAATKAAVKSTPATKSASVTKSKSTTKAAASTSTTQNAAATTSASPTPTAAKTTAAAAPATSAKDGTFTGNAVDVGYGIVQVKIVVSNGKITEASAVQAPSGRSQRFTDYAVPNLRQQTLSANSAAINGVSGASYTSYGWYKSLISALQKAGMPTGA